jgi:Raf kinase inhibitor-like YbhB/YbcL family protein
VGSSAKGPETRRAPHRPLERTPGWMRFLTAAILLALPIWAGGCGLGTGSGPSADEATRGIPVASGLRLAAPGVSTSGALPRVCGGTAMSGGKNVSPALRWTGTPPTGTRSWALAMVDTTAPGRGYVHWLVLDIPVSASLIPTAASGRDLMPPGSAELRNDSGGYGYAGPQPPAGTHTYEFVVYAMPVARAGVGRGASKDVFFRTVATAIGQQTLSATYSATADQ